MIQVVILRSGSDEESMKILRFAQDDRDTVEKVERVFNIMLVWC